MKKLLKSRIFWIALIIIVQSVVYLLAGMGKAYMHMDEAYSLGLANYDKVQIQENEDFYNEWHDAAYFEDYLVVNEDERGDFAPVYNNQRDDVHPPIFYLLLRIGMELTPGKFTKWTGIILNILAFAVGAVFLFLTSEKLLAKEKNRLIKAAILTIVANVTMAALSTVIYIRMYALLTMWVEIVAYLHLRLLEAKALNVKLLAAIAAVTLVGFLTQYYFLFFIVPVAVMMVVKYLREKRWKEMGFYVGSLALAGAVSLAIWPHSIQHLFFGYRGQGAIGKLLNLAGMGEQLGFFAGLMARYTFHYLLPVLLVAMFVLMVKGLRTGKKLQKNQYLGFVLVPALVFFLLAAIMSPFMDLRYIEAVCGLMFVAVMVGMYEILGMFMQEKGRNIMVLVILVVTLILPALTRLEPDVAYTRWAAVVEKVEENTQAPAIYLFNNENDRFLDDILLFTKFDESYVMQGQDYTVKNFEQIFEGKDLSNGIWVFSNYGDDEKDQKYLETIEKATGVGEVVYQFRLNSGKVYLIEG